MQSADLQILMVSLRRCNGHNAALELGAAGIDTTVISDSAIFAMMSRVNKVIIGAQFGTIFTSGRISLVTNERL